ncbi:MurR/RpiR family transcriptional regulator [Alteromonas pelagimontana]|uniref:MurR/RpiR family transcriptional regulator n=1 Tax=Alteromonas pelagimontana TaxID=1858656 RepID=A0A6M4MKU4_9ALTE|nr:MurR/RpiR family transcriptional regulator [Alteromonas pelagimontana]QJR82696.1 MurR/RpiR family transcriptional regulator [Alteromonas pelagimontana]
MTLIEQSYPSLSPSARSIANYLQQQPLALISQSIAEIATNTKTSKATVSRFFRQLGFASHQDAKQALLALRESGFPLNTKSSSLSSHIEQEQKNLSLTFEGLNAQTLQSVATLLATSSRISLIGFRNAYPLALHFRQQLKQVRSTVRVLPQPGQTLAEDLTDMVDDEVVVLVGFRRRTRIFKKIIEALANHTTVLITDPTGQIYNQSVDHLLVCHLGQDSPFDSYAAPMSLISQLCNQVYAALGDKAGKRTRRISQLYAQLDELEI